MDSMGYMDAEDLGDTRLFPRDNEYRYKNNPAGTGDWQIRRRDGVTDEQVASEAARRMVDLLGVRRVSADVC